MIPAPFDYVRAESVDHAVATLVEHGDEAKVLAGGHSLLPLMKLRLAVPEVLVDLGRVDAMKGVCETDDGRLAIGAMTRHQDVLDAALVREHCGVLAAVTEMVGDAQVRHRGTIGGALAHGDAAGDLPALAVALDATLVAAGPEGRREIPAADFFVDYLDTALAEDEILTEVRVPKLGDDWGWRYEKFTRVSQAWAIVGALALVRRSNGSIAEARVGLTNMATVPVRAHAVEQALAGAPPDAIPDAAAAAAEGTTPSGDLNASPEYREHLARVLTRRALQAAAS
ncbi:FAD binding domain-containing protein [Egicoccus halophilus]|uniref:Carbon-monoxide dehydrogenase medium subunit n=1 Tax=Egicoccus halophilus TaxID=1670830 RepID=A0A8J3A7H9_9ACTN|nr:xanthine dehydrogenase family protein subunit M [Egicoccus halophilus]GGI03403.1 carbon-monoxide dehydrogenase medium subunit [Egicoccus halophilus]